MKSFLGLPLVGLLLGTVTAGNTIEITGVGPSNVGVDYSCDASAGVAAIKAIVGNPQKDSPSATGEERSVICDGTSQSSVVALHGSQLLQGQTVQVQVALVDPVDNVVSGQDKLVSLG